MEQHRQQNAEHEKTISDLKKQVADVERQIQEKSDEMGGMGVRLRELEKEHAGEAHILADLEAELAKCMNAKQEGDESTACTTTILAQIVGTRTFRFMNCDSEMTPSNEDDANDTLRKVLAVVKPLKELNPKLALFCHG